MTRAIGTAARRMAPWSAMAALVLGLAGVADDARAQVQIEGEIGATGGGDLGGDFGGGASSPGQEVTRRQIQDWLVQCGRRSPEAPEQCEMIQDRTNESGQPVLVVAVGKVPGSSELGMLMIVPLGIALPAGVSIQIDDGAERPLPVERCEQAGCRIELLVDPDLLGALKAGRAAAVSFSGYEPDGRRRPVTVDLSLLGFTAALAEIYP